jgi:hypothetical protein
MSRRSIVVVALAAVALGCLAGRSTVGVAAAEESGGKIALRVFYVGQPGSDREKDFVSLLEKHFTKVGTGDLAGFKEDQTRDFDVVILDTGDAGRGAPRPQLSKEFARPIITMGVVGAQLCGSLALKTAFA